MFDRFRKRGLLPLAALTLAVMLGGCYYPGYQGYGYGGGYGGGYYAAPYYSGATVAVGGGWRGHDRHYDHDGWRR
jgi:hypothetical protein